jgi:hypothetical protein
MIIGIFIGLFVGFFLGWLACALCVIAGAAARED